MKETMSTRFFIKKYDLYKPASECNTVEKHKRGIYVLYQEIKKDSYNVVYIGMAQGATSGMRGRIKKHLKDVKKIGKWTHFSTYEVWDNLTKEMIAELEALFILIYKKHPNAHAMNIQKKSKFFPQPVQSIHTKAKLPLSLKINSVR